MRHTRAIAIWIGLWAAVICCAQAASPLSPEQERATFQLADPRLTIELVAAEPDVRAPVALAWDADGRMFVAEMTDYPSGPVSGRIRLLEDRDGDSRCEHSTIFATNLAFPNGLMAWRNGLLVTAAPDIWFLADTNNDGGADVREKILTGFTEGNQQLRVNGLYWGIDNWIYGANGRSDGEVKWADGTPAGSIRRKDFRFRPDTKQFEVIAGNSQFGMGQDDWGNRFPAFNNMPIRHVVIEDRYLARQPLLAGTDNVPNVSPTNDGTRVFALTPPTLLIPQPVGHFTSACGPSIYRGTALPNDYRGNYFVCEPVQNVVQRRVLKPNGSTFAAEYADVQVAPVALRPETTRSASRPTLEFLASTDRWFHGVFTANGPDGALYIVDFYRDLVEHPHWVAPELRDKVDWRKGEEHGRIWRVRAKDATLPKRLKLSRATNAELVGALENANGWVRDTAHRLLVERDAREVIAALTKVASRGRVQTQVHALNLLDAFEVLTTEVLLTALNESDARVREHAVRLAESALASPPGSRTERKLRSKVVSLAKDNDARLRLQVACSLSALPDEQRLAALALLCQHEQLDDWQSLAILSSAGERPWLLVQRLVTKDRDPGSAQLALLERAARMIAAGTHAEDKQAMLGWIAHWKSIHRVSVASAFVAGFKSKSELRTADTDGQSLPAIFAAAHKVAFDRAAPERLRVVSIPLLPPGDLAPLVQRDQPESVQIAAAGTLMESGNVDGIRDVLNRIAGLGKVVRRQAIVSSVRSRAAALELTRAVAEEKVALVEIDPTTRQALERFADPEVKARAVKLFASAVSADRDAVVQKYRFVLKLPADQKHGAAVFEKNCAVCHQVQGVGAKIGLDLSGTGQQPRETLLVQILDPSRQVLPDFVAYTAEMNNGESYVGFIANESPGAVTLRRANEPDVTLKRSEVRKMKTNGKSLMPDGLEAAMSEQDMADLIEFLRRPDRTLFTTTQ